MPKEPSLPLRERRLFFCLFRGRLPQTRKDATAPGAVNPFERRRHSFSGIVLCLGPGGDPTPYPRGSGLPGVRDSVHGASDRRGSPRLALRDCRGEDAGEEILKGGLPSRSHGGGHKPPDLPPATPSNLAVLKPFLPPSPQDSPPPCLFCALWTPSPPPHSRRPLAYLGVLRLPARHPRWDGRAGMGRCAQARPPPPWRRFRSAGPPIGLRRTSSGASAFRFFPWGFWGQGRR